MIDATTQSVPQTIYSTLRTYYYWIPNQTSQTAAKAFCYSVVATVMLGAIATPAAPISVLVLEGVHTGLISALATYIHGMTTPFFLALHINAIPAPIEFARRGIVWYLTSAITNLYPTMRIDLYSTIALAGTHLILELIANSTWTYPTFREGEWSYPTISSRAWNHPTYEPPIMLPLLGTDSNLLMPL